MKLLRWLGSFFAVLLLGLNLSDGQKALNSSDSPADTKRMNENYTQLPLSFEANRRR